MRTRAGGVLALCMLAAFAHAQGAQVDAVAAEIAPDTSTVFPEESPMPPAPPASEIDMTPFQDAYDRERAEAQAETLGDTSSTEAAPRARRANQDNLAALLGQSAVALLVICGLILLAGWALRRFGGKTPLLAGASLAQVLGRTYLEPKTALHFVKTGGRVLVIGVTPNNISLLTEFEAEQFEGAASGSPSATANNATDFRARLREQQEKTVSTAVPEDEDLDALRGDIQRLKQYLQDSRRGAGM